MSQLSVGSKGCAVVTGASKRIGKAIALDLARHGWSVAVHYASGATEADAVCQTITAQGGRAVALRADLSDPGAGAEVMRKAVAALGPVTCLVNNASVFLEDDITTVDPAVWDRQFAVNLRAPVLLAQAFAAALPADRTGCIVNLIDQRVLAPTPRFLSYGIAKSGLYAATRMLAQALAPRIRVNGIGPGPVLPSIYQTAESFAAEVESTLLRRATPPEEIAATVRYILDAPSLTGQMIALDAGQHLSRAEPH